MPTRQHFRHLPRLTLQIFYADDARAVHMHVVQVNVDATGGQGAAAAAQPVEKAGLFLRCALPPGLPTSTAFKTDIDYKLQALRTDGATPVQKELHTTLSGSGACRGYATFFLASKALDIAAWEPFLIDGRVRMSVSVLLRTG